MKPREEPESEPQSHDQQWLVGGGEMGELIRSTDWSAHPLGPLESWPNSLRTTVSLCLASNFPINILWGQGSYQIYNDGYTVILGKKHPEGLGMGYKECWESAWPEVGQPFHRAWAGETSFIEDRRMFVERGGYLEETFFTFSLSPIRDERGIVAGLFLPVTETRAQMLGQRRTKALGELAANTAKARTLEESFACCAETFTEHSLDLPFVLLYSISGDGAEARLVASAGIERGLPVSPEQVRFAEEADRSWRMADILGANSMVEIPGLKARFGEFACGPYPEGANVALARALRVPGVNAPLGIIIAGISPRLPFDQEFREHVERVASAVDTALGNALAYQRERQRAEELAALDRTKTQFFSNVSHEFRTPLTLMLGPLDDALGQAGLSAQVREELEVAQRNSLRLLRLVNSMLDFSRIEAGRVKAVYQPTDLSALTAGLASIFRSATERAGLQLTIECPPLPEPVFVDVEMWEKVVLNLLSNAFKFTFDGGIVVELTPLEGAVELRVSDTGVGIPEHELPRLFERFHRVEGTRGRTFEGTGIGLALVQELVRLHGGTIAIESVLGRGSTFRVRIPLGTAHLPPEQIGGERELSSTAVRAEAFVAEALRWLPDDVYPSPVAGPSELTDNENADAASARVLVVDDNADMRDYIRRLLSGRYEVVTAADGEEGLASALHARPDLVLTDIMMPGMDGFEMIDRLRAAEPTSTIPIIVLSARAGEESRVEGLDKGADDYLIKPFSAIELQARVRTHLSLAESRKRATDAIRNANEQLEARVEERTRELRQSEQLQATLAAELQHRVRNVMAIIRSIAARTSESAASVEEYAQSLSGRLLSLTRTQGMLVRSVDGGVDLERLVREELGAHAQTQGEYEVQGPEVAISPKAAEVLSLAIHELATNALKYGALSEPHGRVSVSWKLAPQNGTHVLSLRWQENRARPMPHSPSPRRGFGTEMIERRIPYELKGSSKLSFDERGAQCTIEFPLRDGTSILETALPRHVPARNGSNGLKSAGLEGSSILIVEDDFYAAETLERELRKSGARIVGPFSQEDSALSGLQAHRADAALVDINLGNGPSFEIARTLRANDVPVIFITGYEQSMIPAEFADVLRLPKPLDIKAISRALEGLLASSRLG